MEPLFSEDKKFTEQHTIQIKDALKLKCKSMKKGIYTCMINC